MISEEAKKALEPTFRGFFYKLEIEITKKEGGKSYQTVLPVKIGSLKKE